MSNEAQPVIVVARARPRPEASAHIIAVLSEIIPVIQAEPGCERYALAESEDGELFMIQRWASADDAARHAASSPTIAELGERLDRLVDGAPTVSICREIVVGDAAKGRI